MGKENIWLAEEKKNGEGKGGKHLEKEIIRKRKRTLFVIVILIM